MPYFLILFLFCFVPVANVHALEIQDVIAAAPTHEIFPESDRLELVTDHPGLAWAYRGQQKTGVVYLNHSLVNSTGYSGKPIYVLVGLDMQGVVRKAQIVEHHEPIVLIGIPQSKIDAVIDTYIGLDIIDLMQQSGRDLPYDAVSGATVTIRVIDDSIIRSAIKVSRQLGLGSLSPEVKAQATELVEIDTTQQQVRSWDELVSDGSIARLVLNQTQVDTAFAALKDSSTAGEPVTTSVDEDFIDLYTAQVSVPSIGRSLLGDREYENLQKRLEPGQQAIVVVANGPYSFKGSGYVRGGIFDRFVVIQNDNSISFRDADHKRIRRIAAQGAPDFKDVDVFRIPGDIKFDNSRPWSFELLVGREIGPRKKEFVTFQSTYQIPKSYLKITPIAPPAKPEIKTAFYDEAESSPLWKSLWQEKTGQIVILSVALMLLTWIFFFQDWLVQRPVLLSRLRMGFLIFTLFWLGWYANAQLSVVNILTVFNALVSGFSWSYFLMDPLVFILWGGVAGALLFWGRGAYCGWLCPFGALQELVNKVARFFNVRQIRVPWRLHERLWALKYILFLVLFGVSLHSLSMAEQLAEVEPFKTGIILKFIRDWPFVAFALLMVGASVFIERFYCRYLCPLGAALAIPARLRMFEWLKRYRQCGNPCQQCANDCMVQAIHPEGQINPNECLYCQHCQVLYYDDHKCPVVLQKRLKKERRASKGSAESAVLAEKLLTEIRQHRQQKAAQQDE